MTVTELMEREPVPNLPPASERVRLRKRFGLTQEQVADALMVNVRSIRRWERGIDPREHTIRSEYAKLLNSWSEQER
jgi:transcriptional regulator with XRE-family HTH domain